MGPIKKADIVAGMAASAASSAGGDVEEQVKNAQFAFSMVERAEAEEKKRKAENVLEPPPKLVKTSSEPAHELPKQPHRGFLARAAQWLNLR